MAFERLDSASNAKCFLTAERRITACLHNFDFVRSWSRIADEKTSPQLLRCSIKSPAAFARAIFRGILISWGISPRNTSSCYGDNPEANGQKTRLHSQIGNRMRPERRDISGVKRVSALNYVVFKCWKSAELF